MIPLLVPDTKSDVIVVHGQPRYRMVPAPPPVGMPFIDLRHDPYAPAGVIYGFDSRYFPRSADDPHAP